MIKLNEPFLVHKANLEKWRPRAYDVKADYVQPEDAKYEVASMWKFYSKDDPNSPGGHNLIMDLQFRVVNDRLHSDLDILPTLAGSEVSVQFFNGRPAVTPQMLLRFGVLRRRHIPADYKVSRDGDIITTSYFRFTDAGDDYNGYRFELQLTYHNPSSRHDLLLEQGKVLHIAIVQDHKQTTIVDFTT